MFHDYDHDPVGEALVSMLQERFITPHHSALMAFVLSEEQQFAKLNGDRRPVREDIRVSRRRFAGYDAVIEHERNGETGRVDVFYTNDQGTLAVIGSWRTVPCRFKVDFVYGHAVVKHGTVIEWWLVHKHGRYRVSPLDAEEMAKTLLYRVFRSLDYDPALLRDRSLKLAGTTAAAALLICAPGAAAVSGATATATAVGRLGQAFGAMNLGRVLGESAQHGREVVKNAIMAHQALMLECVVGRLRAFDKLAAEARASGKPIPDDHLYTHDLVPGYSVTARFTQTPGEFTVHYSGDDGVPFGNNQGTVEFHNHQLTSWWFLSGKKRLKLV
ncbi:hypothetical protein [Streptomyces sp. NPDC001165]|uniref:hypothetical protein n=1 Tax=Streptomyces sp. NPDC001165 TaxID=3364546 RepID=UPI00367539AC